MALDNRDIEREPLSRIRERREDGEQFDIDIWDIEFPETMHHSTVKARLNILIEEGEVEPSVADRKYKSTFR